MAKIPRTPEEKLAAQQTRLKYLQRVDPKSKEIKELQDKIAAAGGSTDPNSNGSYDRGTVEDFLDKTFSSFKPLDLTGMDRQAVQDSLYAENTKYLDRNRARDLEETKQELANRGIPYNPNAAFDPNTKDLYGKTVGAIDEQYKTDQSNALNNARTGADQRYSSYVDSAVKGYTTQLDAANTGNNLLNTLMQDYHMTKDEALQKLNIKTQKQIAMAKNGGSGGGSGGGGAQTNGFDVSL